MRCEQEGVVGSPACPEGESCQRGVCVGCSRKEICGDGVDNDCNGVVDDICGDAGSEADAGDASSNPDGNLGLRVKDSLVVLYTFFDEGDGLVHDVSGIEPPLDLTIMSPQNVKWLPGGGLRIDAPTLISSQAAATKVAEKCSQSNALTVEAWIRTDGLGQGGPARIVSMSVDPYQRNFTLGQEQSTVDVRLRTTTTGNNGMPSIVSETGSLSTEIVQVVYVRNSGGFARIVIDGVQVGSGQAEGDLSNWDASYPLALANELGDDPRSWRGAFYLVAVYARALTPTELETNLAAGIPGFEAR